MADVLDMPHIGSCTIDACSYNDHSSGCHAGAITVVDAADGGASCGTFIPLTIKGGLDKVVAEVGACHRAECTHNDHLECSATAVRIGAGPDDAAHPGCLTFERRSA